MDKDKAYCLAEYKGIDPFWIIVNKFFDVQGYCTDNLFYREHCEADNLPLWLDGWRVVMHEELVQW